MFLLDRMAGVDPVPGPLHLQTRKHITKDLET